jgi:hypothetical protein
MIGRGRARMAGESGCRPSRESSWRLVRVSNFLRGGPDGPAIHPGPVDTSEGRCLD